MTTAQFTHREFFGDKEHDFRLVPEQVIELERKLDTGIGTLFQRLIAGNFRHADIGEVVRHALVGGGTSPKEAEALIAAYVVPRPYAEVYPLVVSILETLWFGKAKGGPDGSN
jgi:hypothetical protein